MRGQPSLHRDVGSLAQEAAAGGQKGAGVAYSEGDVLYPKINNVKLMRDPSDSAGVLASLQKHDEMIFMGTEQNGYVQVETGSGGGWVKKVLVTR